MDLSINRGASPAASPCISSTSAPTTTATATRAGCSFSALMAAGWPPGMRATWGTTASPPACRSLRLMPSGWMFPLACILSCAGASPPLITRCLKSAPRSTASWPLPDTIHRGDPPPLKPLRSVSKCHAPPSPPISVRSGPSTGSLVQTYSP